MDCPNSVIHDSRQDSVFVTHSFQQMNLTPYYARYAIQKELYEYDSVCSWRVIDHFGGRFLQQIVLVLDKILFEMLYDFLWACCCGPFCPRL